MLKMTFLPKLLIFIVGINLISAKSHYYDYHHQPYRNFHIPWAIKFPQPLISIDGAWPIGSPPGMYPHYPLKEYEEYPYPEEDYQQELLVKSLNQALIKLNQLLPPSNSNTQETTPFPPTTKPEVLAEALNKAIDRLGVLLARQPQKVPNTDLPDVATTVNEPEIVATTEKAPEIVATTVKELEIVATTETVATTEQSTASEMVSEKLSESVLNAIDEINKLFGTLPDELKPSEVSVTNNKENTPVKPFLSNPAPFISPENMVNPLFLSKTTEGKLFTSNVLEQNEVTERAQPTTSSVPNIVSNLGISTENTEENKLETTSSSEVPTDVPTIENKDQTTDLPIKDAETDMTTIKNDESSMIPQIDIRFQEREDSGFIFPDEFETLYNKKPMQQELNLPPRFGEQTSTNPNPQIVLEYKPSRPPFHPDVFPPHPTPRPDSNLQTSTEPSVGDRFQSTQKPVVGNQNPQIILEYKPSRPPFHPDVFPPHPTARPQPDSNLQTSTEPSLGDRFQSTTANSQNPQIILEYKPSRPPFHPDIYPPHPTPRPQIPQTDSNPQTTVDVGDRFQSTTAAPVKSTTAIVFTTTQAIGPYVPTHYYPTPISLEYVPSRPFYAPNPIVYPRPGAIPPGTPWPASSTERPRN